jgi:hypothetical protein
VFFFLCPHKNFFVVSVQDSFFSVPQDSSVDFFSCCVRTRLKYRRKKEKKRREKKRKEKRRKEEKRKEK